MMFTFHRGRHCQWCYADYYSYVDGRCPRCGQYKYSRRIPYHEPHDRGQPNPATINLLALSTMMIVVCFPSLADIDPGEQ